MATPTSAGASPAAHSPPEEVEVEDVDELTAVPDEEPPTAAEAKPAHVGLVRVSRCSVAACTRVTMD